MSNDDVRATAFDLFRSAWQLFGIDTQGETWVVEFAGGATFAESRERADELRDLHVAHAWLQLRREQREALGCDEIRASRQVMDRNQSRAS